ncbi:hypothetical protein HNQ57_001638 [Zhongshania antarctica]|uniref:Uncharacterized protein n=1 Tax=Zhongshania antarctica TaxID=641702 RepID=A0A840R2J4_9GAMM|nr:conjugal transfer protein TraF [Zhongshania antarctica]MBB5187369.1 hypothetical protein [Zhongshania antarctica]
MLKCNSRLLLIGATCLVPHALNAMPGALPAGTSLISKGGYSATFSPSPATNPAVLPIALGARNFIVGGLALPAAIAFEIGQVDNLTDRLDGLEEAVDNAESAQSDGGEDVTQAEADAIKAEFDSFVAQLGDDAYVNLQANLNLPVLPVMFKAFGGVVAVTLEGSADVKLTGYGNELTYDGAAQELNFDAAVYVESGVFTQLGVAYGYEFGKVQFANQDFDLNLGGRLKITQGSLSQQLIVLDDDDDDDDSASDRAEDNYDLNKKNTLAIGLDVGAVVSNSEMHLGVVLRNLIPEKFDFTELGMNCASKPTPTEQADCNSAAKYAGKIGYSSSYKLDPQLMLDGSYMIPGSGFRAFGSVETNSVETVTGSEYQWLVAGVGYSGAWWLPSIHVAYNKNLAGEKIDMISLGADLFRVLNLQVSVSPDKAKVDGDSIYRAAAVSIGLFTSF